MLTIQSSHHYPPVREEEGPVNLSKDIRKDVNEDVDIVYQRRQSQRVKRRKVEQECNSETIEKKRKLERNEHLTERSSTDTCSQFKVSTLSQLPTFTHKTAQSLGMCCSSLVSRSQKSQHKATEESITTKQTNYNVFEDPIIPVQFSQLPHPSQLFGKSRISMAKRHFDRESVVNSHLRQLKGLQARWDEEKVPYQGTHQVSKQTNDNAISSKEDGSRILNASNSTSEEVSGTEIFSKRNSGEWDELELWLKTRPVGRDQHSKSAEE